MTESIIILIRQDNPIQLRLAIRLKRSFTEKQVVNVQIKTPKTWLNEQASNSGPSAINRTRLDIVFDLNADSGLSPAILATGYQHVILGGFQRGYLQPVCHASGTLEVADRTPHTDFVIVLATKDNGWTTMLHASFPTLRTWQENQQQLIAAGADYTFLWWQECQRSNKALRFGAEVECKGISTARTSRWLKLSILIRRSFDRIYSRLRREFRRNQYWQIGWLELGQNAALAARKLPNRGSIWFADPYIWRDRQQRIWLLCEHYDETGDHLGCIALFEITEDKQALSHGIILKEHFHLSFPRLIDLGEKLYCTVESYQNNDVRLYSSDSITEGWKLERTLLKGEAFIDPVLFLHEDGYWYLFVNTTSVPSIKREVAPELRLFFCADLLTGDFREHPESPLMISSRGGRNGGMILLDKLYRVGQQTGYGGVYGESVTLFRIDELSTTTYRETPVQHPPTSLQLGCLENSLRATHLHTLNNHGRLLVFDFMSS